jgi:hypothetical protein
MADPPERPKNQSADAPPPTPDGAGAGTPDVGPTYAPGTKKIFKTKPANLAAFGFQTPQIAGHGADSAKSDRGHGGSGDQVRPTDHAKSSAASVKQFAESHGVSVTPKNGRYEFALKAGGRTEYIGSAESLATGEKLLHDKVIARENELRKTYRVDFSSEKDPPGKQLAAGAETKTPLRYRDPTLAELSAVKASLERIRPTQDNLAGEPGPRFNFLKDHYDSVIPKAARFVLEHDGRSSVNFDPGWSNGRPPTELDLRNANEQSMQRAIDHEFGHHSLATMHGARNDAHDMRDNRDAISKIYSSLGWKEVAGRLMLEGRDHSYYTPEGTDAQRYWLRHDASGRPADGQGKATSEQNAEKLAPTQMMIRSTVEPISEYFPGPDEMYAEGFSAFSSGERSRLDLKFAAPKLYDVVKEADQNQINQKYPPLDGHTPRIIRAPDGTLLPNSPANAARLSEFEKRPNKSGIVPFNTLPLQ